MVSRTSTVSNVFFYLLMYIFSMGLDLEKVLVDVGALKENDTRLKKRSDSDEGAGTRPGIRRTNGPVVDDDDDDWD